MLLHSSDNHPHPPLPKHFVMFPCFLYSLQAAIYIRGGGGEGGRGGKGEEAMRELNLLPKSTTQGPLWGVDPRPLDRESGLVTITLACLLIPTHALLRNMLMRIV